MLYIQHIYAHVWPKVFNSMFLYSHQQNMNAGAIAYVDLHAQHHFATYKFIR